NRTQIHRLLDSAVPGSKVMLGIHRDGKAQELTVILGEGYRASADDRERLFGEVNAFLLLADEKHYQADELRLTGAEKDDAELYEQEKGIRRDADERRAFIEKELREGKIQASSTLFRSEIAPSSTRYNLGLSAIELSDQLAKFFNVTGSGVLITEVRAEGLA